MLASSLHVGFYVRVVMSGAGQGTAIYVNFIILFVFSVVLSYCVYIMMMLICPVIFHSWKR